MFKHQPERGFTLIELLVVVSLITFLLSVVLPMFTQAQRESRDSQRIATVKQLKNALDLYWTEHWRYPQPSSGPCVQVIGWDPIHEFMTEDVRDPVYQDAGYTEANQVTYRYCTPSNADSDEFRHLYGRSYGIRVYLEDERRRVSANQTALDYSGQTSHDGFCKTGVNVDDFPGEWQRIPMCNF